jgi:hypothetical protein
MAAKEISVTRYVVRAVRGADQEGKEPGEKVVEGSDMLKADVCDDELWHKKITGCPASTSTSKNGTQRGTTRIWRSAARLGPRWCGRSAAMAL